MPSQKEMKKAKKMMTPTQEKSSFYREYNMRLNKLRTEEGVSLDFLPDKDGFDGEIRGHKIKVAYSRPGTALEDMKEGSIDGKPIKKEMVFKIVEKYKPIVELFNTDGSLRYPDRDERVDRYAKEELEELYDDQQIKEAIKDLGL